MKCHLGDMVLFGLVPMHDFISELQLHLLLLNLILQVILCIISIHYIN